MLVPICRGTGSIPTLGSRRKHQIKRAECGGTVFRCIIRETNIFGLFMPVSLVFFDGFCKHGIDRTMCPLDRCIRNRPISRASEILDTHHSGQMLQNRVYKLRPIVMDLQLAGAVYQVDVFQQCIRDC